MISEFLSDRWRKTAIVGAIALGFIAQYLYTGEFLTHWTNSNTWTWEPRYTVATVILFIALVLATWALAGRLPTFESLNMLGVTSIRNESDKRFPWLALAIGGYAACLYIYLAIGESTLVQLLWFGSAAIFIYGLWQQSVSQPDIEPVPWWQWLIVLPLTALGFILRYWHLTEIPSHVDNDVALMGTFGSQLIDLGNFNWVGASESQHLLSYDQFLAWSMRLFGENHYGLVMHSVIFGTLTLVLVFLLGRYLFNWRVGVIAMALLTISYTHIQFSRILFGPTSTFFATLTLYLLFRGLKTSQSRWFALAGVASGFGLLVYDSSRVIPIIVLAIVAWRLLWQPKLFFANFKNWCFFAFGALLGFGPMLGFALQDFDAFVGRGNAVTIWSPDVWQHEAESYQMNDVGEVVLEQTKRTFLTFYLYGDGSPHFAFPRPMVSPLTAMLLTIGVGFCLWRLRDIRCFALLAWIVLTFILGGVLTYDPPYWPHLNIVLPAVVVIAGAAADKILEILSPQSNVFGYLSLRVLGVGLVAFTGITSWQAYTAFVANNAGGRIRLARFINELQPGFQVYLVSDDVDWSEYAFQFFNRGVDGHDATVDQLETAPPSADKPLLFVYMNHQDSIDRLAEIYPDGELEEHYNDTNSEDPAFVTLAVIPPNYKFAPRPAPVNPATLPGWWLIAALLIAPVVPLVLRRFRPQPVLVTPDP